MSPLYSGERNKRRNAQGCRAGLGPRGVGSEPRPGLPPPTFAERKELGDLFALNSLNQVAPQASAVT